MTPHNPKMRHVHNEANISIHLDHHALDLLESLPVSREPAPRNRQEGDRGMRMKRGLRLLMTVGSWCAIAGWVHARPLSDSDPALRVRADLEPRQQYGPESDPVIEEPIRPLFPDEDVIAPSPPTGSRSCGALGPFMFALMLLSLRLVPVSGTTLRRSNEGQAQGCHGQAQCRHAGAGLRGPNQAT